MNLRLPLLLRLLLLTTALSAPAKTLQAQISFGEAQGIPGASDLNLIQSADLDSDGDVDILNTVPAVRWVENTVGARPEWTVHDIGDTSGTRDMAVADIDGDGDLDIVRGHIDSDLWSWHENINGDASAWRRHSTAFEPVTDRANGFSSLNAVHTGDLDADGDLDVLTGAGIYFPGQYGFDRSRGGEAISWWTNEDGNGGAWQEHAVGSIPYISDVHAADINGDGDVDVVAVSTLVSRRSGLGSANWWEAVPGNGRRNWAPMFIAAGSRVTGARVADMDVDGDLDVLILRNETDPLLLWENAAGDGLGWNERPIPNQPEFRWSNAEVADVDCDGDLDVLGILVRDRHAFGEPGDLLAAWLNNGRDLTLWEEVEVDLGWLNLSKSFHAADINGDGAVDLIGSTRFGNMYWWENLTDSDQGGKLSNRAPVIDPLGPYELLEGEHLNFTLFGTDADGDEVRFIVQDKPEGALFEGNVFSWTPHFRQAGEYYVHFLASDGRGGITKDTVYFRVQNNSRPPELNSIGNQFVQAGHGISIFLSAVDPDVDDTVIFALGGAPSGARLVGNEFSWQPTIDQVGVYELTFTADDGAGKSDSETVKVTVSAEANRAPSISVGGYGSVRAGEKFRIALSGSDLDGDPLRFLLLSAPAGAYILGDFFEWVPGSGQAGSHVARLGVTDGKGGISSRDITLTVTAPPSSTPTTPTSPPPPPPPPPQPVVTEKPELDAPVAELDFGEVNLGSSATMTLSLRNTGAGEAVSAPLTLLGSSRRRFSLGQERLQIPASSTGQLEITYTPITFFATSDTVILIIKFGSVFYETTLTGKGVEPVVIDVGNDRLDFGDGYRGEGESRTLWVRNAGESELVVESIGIDAPFSVALNEFQVAAGDSQSIEVHYARSAIGEASATLYIQSNAKNDPKLPVGLFGSTSLRPAIIALSEVEFDFGKGKVGQIADKTLRISNTGEDTLYINEVEATSDHFRVVENPDKIAPSDSGEIKVRYLRSRVAVLEESLSIASNADNQPVATVVLLGEAADPPILSLEPAGPLNFGETDIGQRRVLSFIAENSGGETLIDTLRVEGAGFSLASRSIIDLKPGEIMKIEVVFSPDEDRSFSGRLRHRTNDPAIPQFVQDLNGAGRLAVMADFYLDFDPNPGSQDRREAVLSDSSEFLLGVYAGPVKGLVGYSLQLGFDPAQVELLGIAEGGNGEANALASVNATPLFLQTETGEDGKVGFGGAILRATTSTLSHDGGLLAICRFRTRAGFGHTQILLEKVSLQFLEGKGALYPELGATLEPSPDIVSPVRLDLDPALGNQEVLAVDMAPGGDGTVQFHLAGIAPPLGFGLTVGYDPTVLSLRPEDFVLNAADNASFLPVVRQAGTHAIDIGAVSLERVPFNGSLLGQLPFAVAPDFIGETEIRLSSVFVQSADRPDLIIRSPQTVLIRVEERVAGDFNGDGQVDFLDFFDLTDALGRDDAEPQFDLDGDGDVDVADFFAFVDLFDAAGAAKLLALAEEHLGVLPGVALEANAPNPFNAETAISYRLGGRSAALVELSVYDITGSRIRTLVRGQQGPGRHTAVWDGRDGRGRRVASGVYFYRLQAGKSRLVKKMLLVQ